MTDPMTVRKQDAWIVGVFFAVALVVILTVAYTATAPVRKTRKICSDAVNGFVSSNVLPNDVKDAWGNRIEFLAEPSTTQVVYIARSAGLDKKFGTDDDIVETRIDYNKSRIIGEWVGSRTKEFAKGVISGATKPTKFEEPK